MWRFCASLPLFPSLCTPGLRVNDPCLPTSKGHGPMACIVQPPFGHFSMVFSLRFTILCFRFCQHVLIYIFKRLSGNANQNSAIYAALPRKNARASRLLSVSCILSLRSCIVLACSRHIGAFYDVWNMQTFITIFFLIFECYRISDIYLSNQPTWCTKFLFYNKFISCLYMFRAPCAHHQEVKIILYSLWYHHTYRCDDFVHQVG